MKKNVQEFITTHIANIEDRIALNKCESNVRNLLDYKKKINNEASASIMLACKVDVNFVVAQRVVNQHFNVHSLKRVAEIASFISNGTNRLNEMFEACIRTAFALALNDMTIYSDDFKAACSRHCAASSQAYEEYIVRYQKALATTSTANAQSTMNFNALQVFNVLERVASDKRSNAYRVDFNAKATRLLAEKLNIDISARINA